MGKKRKVRSSEPDSSTIAPESEQSQDLAQIEAEVEAETRTKSDRRTRRPERNQRRRTQNHQKKTWEDDTENGEQGEDSKEANDDEEDFDEEPIEKLLEPFGKDQLVVLIKEGVSKYPDLMDSVHKLADADPLTARSLFTTRFLVSPRVTVSFCSSTGLGKEGAERATEEDWEPHDLVASGLGWACPSTASDSPPVSEYTQRKIFVSNVSAEIDPQKAALSFFPSIWEIEDGPWRNHTRPLKATHCTARRQLMVRSLESPFISQHHQQYHPHSSRKEKGRYSSGGGAGNRTPHGSIGAFDGFNPAVAAPALTPALGQALTALLASQGAGLGIGNLLGGLGAQMNQGVAPAMNNPGYGNQPGGSYGNQQVMQGGYQNHRWGKVLVGRRRVRVHTWVNGH
ncbi:UBP1-associated protein 2A [Actinidia rufa]|uniref:UBP1-associated protein 2A n=1 Tax=Actinidia rufa TaxID=165716 RepID=A0A7J0H4P1_9ERIC|nr:UBP1-associated protein 2A [Actinidia rufa]